MNQRKHSRKHTQKLRRTQLTGQAARPTSTADTRIPAHPLPQRQCSGLDAFRLPAALLVIAIHTSPLVSFYADADFFLTRILARIAVPYFFMVTGYFILSDPLTLTVRTDPEKAAGFLADGSVRPHTSGVPFSRTAAGNRRERYRTRLKGYFKKVTLLYAISVLIYLPLGIYAGHYQDGPLHFLHLLLTDGTFYHLWYFPACITGSLLLLLLRRLLPAHALAPAVLLLYIAGLLGDSYYGLLATLPALKGIYDGLFQLFGYTRNGLFFAPIFLLMGALEASRSDYTLPEQDAFCLAPRDTGRGSGHSGRPLPEQDGHRPAPRDTGRDSGRRTPGAITLPKRSINSADRIGLAVSFLLMTAEGFLLHRLNWQRHDSMYLFLIPCMYFLFRLLLAASIFPSGAHRLLPGRLLRSLSTWIYILHPAVIVLIRGIAKAVSFTQPLVDNSLLHYLAVCLVSILTSLCVCLALPRLRSAPASH